MEQMEGYRTTIHIRHFKKIFDIQNIREILAGLSIADIKITTTKIDFLSKSTHFCLNSPYNGSSILCNAKPLMNYSSVNPLDITCKDCMRILKKLHIK